MENLGSSKTDTSCLPGPNFGELGSLHRKHTDKQDRSQDENKHAVHDSEDSDGS